jgi:hypothetical protein
MAAPFVSLVVPAYNEECRIERSLQWYAATGRYARAGSVLQQTSSR